MAWTLVVLFQSLIWVACPTGLRDHPMRRRSRVSIPHMGCMPYGQASPDNSGHTSLVSIPHMGCMPYGLCSISHLHFGVVESLFQSLIWVACPTGVRRLCWQYWDVAVSIPHMGCMPYGRAPRASRAAAARVSIPHMGCMPYGPGRAPGLPIRCLVSIPHMGCMPYGPGWLARRWGQSLCFNPSYGLHALRAQSGLCTALDSLDSFNPSYGLHALRATQPVRDSVHITPVSIPHMGCMPYGPSLRSIAKSLSAVSIPHMGCMPYGPTCFIRCLDSDTVSIPHMGCMPYGLFVPNRVIWYLVVSIPHMGCMPYGLEIYENLRPTLKFQSLIWVACPTGVSVLG